MSRLAPPLRHSGVAIALHWLIALGLAATFAVGVWMVDLPVSPLRLRLYNWHKWAGVMLLALTLSRLVEVRVHPPPPDLPGPRWQRRLARLLHRLLLGLGVVVPLAGWAYSDAAGFPVVLFGLLRLPQLLPADRALAEQLRPWHAVLAWVMAILVVGHVAAALKHQFIDRDHLLRRMWPFRP